MIGRQCYQVYMSGDAVTRQVDLYLAASTSPFVRSPFFDLRFTNSLHMVPTVLPVLAPFSCSDAAFATGGLGERVRMETLSVSVTDDPGSALSSRIDRAVFIVIRHFRFMHFGVLTEHFIHMVRER
jgi:hypothetical protein